MLLLSLVFLLGHGYLVANSYPIDIPCETLLSKWDKYQDNVLINRKMQYQVQVPHFNKDRFILDVIQFLTTLVDYGNEYDSLLIQFEMNVTFRNDLLAFASGDRNVYYLSLAHHQRRICIHFISWPGVWPWWSRMMLSIVESGIIPLDLLQVYDRVDATFLDVSFPTTSSFVLAVNESISKINKQEF